jgi:hypothetical protein
LTVLAAAGLVACGDSLPSNPVNPTPPPPPPELVVHGHVVEYGTGRAIPGATVQTDLQVAPIIADAYGDFRIGGVTSPRTFRVTIEAQGHVTRETYLRLEGSTRNVTVDLLPAGGNFSLDFYRQLGRDASESPELEPIWRLPESPSIYIRTVDQNGRAIEPEALRGMMATIPKAVSDWSAGKLAAKTIETGVETRPRTPGWIVVNILRDKKTEICGNAFVGAIDGQIQLWDDACSCGSDKLPGALIAHEIGHALGFFHVTDDDAVMHRSLPGRCPNGNLTARERYHAAVAYNRARLNADPDVNPTTMTPLSVGAAPFVEN